MSSAFRRLGLTVLPFTLLAAAACTENDTELVNSIGVTRLLLLDPAAAPQRFLAEGSSLQVAEWRIAGAALNVGAQSYSLASDGSCVITDTAFLSSVAIGDCAGGIVIPSSAQAQEISLSIEFESMQVRRAAPPDLSGIDFDGDGVPNDGDGSGSAFDRPCGLGGDSLGCDDNCPLLANPDQADSNNDGLGNACSVFDFFTSSIVADSDGDSVPDAFDNCVWEPNPEQADSGGLTASGITDGIGDACTEQIADVRLDGSTTFTLELGPVSLIQPLGQTSFATVDFDNSITLDCDFSTLQCDLDADQVTFCALVPGVDALNGCP